MKQLNDNDQTQVNDNMIMHLTPDPNLGSNDKETDYEAHIVRT